MIRDLKVRIQLERPESVGGVVSFIDAGGAWAALDDAERPRFAIRMRRDVRAGWRVVWDARRFRIAQTLDDGERRDLICEEELP
jgi:head-tail adaptor